MQFYFFFCPGKCVYVKHRKNNNSNNKKQVEMISGMKISSFTCMKKFKNYYVLIYKSEKQDTKDRRRNKVLVIPKKLFL